MSDIAAYNSANEYTLYQSLRPDYTAAIATTLAAALQQTAEKRKSQKPKRLSVADFCSGTGTNTKRFAQSVGGIERATFIDTNAQFLAKALTSNIQAEILDVRRQDILTAKFAAEYDLVLSVFAYHHVPDKNKSQYLTIARDCLKPDGTLILTEIYLGTKSLCQRYYDALLDAIPVEKRTAGLEQFLRETAQSTDFEFKVHKQFADAQIQSLGLTIVDEKKIWPTIPMKDLPNDAGTFVQVIKIK